MSGGQVPGAQGPGEQGAGEQQVVFWSVGISPVQAWISEARRSRDLLAGSRILVWMISQVLRQLLQQEGLRCILPSLSKVQPDVLPDALPIEPREAQLAALPKAPRDVLAKDAVTLPNRASGTWSGVQFDEACRRLAGLGSSLHEAWNELEQAVHEVWDRRCDDSKNGDEHALWRLLKPQLSGVPCPFELVWTACTASGEEEAYGAGMERLEQLYSDAKRSRPVRTHRDGGEVRKCGQCGRREAMGLKAEANAGAGRGAGEGKTDRIETWKRFQEELGQLPEVQQGLRLAQDEYLCSVCALRRLFGYLRLQEQGEQEARQPFPSTSKIAAADWLGSVWALDTAKSKISELERLARRVPGFQKRWEDTAPLLYGRTVRRLIRLARRGEGGRNERDIAALEAVLVAQKELAEILDAPRHSADPARLEPLSVPGGAPVSIPEPASSREVALLGTARPSIAPSQYLAVLMFDGDDMGRRLQQDLDELPRRILSFQSNLTKALDDGLCRARAFYLGGDEGLCLVPAGQALTLAEQVAKLWRSHVDSPPAAAGVGCSEGQEEGRPSLSAGLVFFDRERPLGPAIERARHCLEQQAKGMKGKSSLAATVLTASGSRWSVVARWGQDWQRLRRAVELIREGRLASGWAQDVGAFLAGLPEQVYREGEDSRQALRAELRRLTKRRTEKSTEGGTWDRTEGRVEKVAELWRDLQGESWLQQQPDEEELPFLSQQLSLVAFLTRQQEGTAS